MKKMSETITFFGSGPVAAESLRLLAQSFSIEAVITKPRPAHHKGTVPVLDVASELGLTIHTVSDKQALKTLFESRPVKSRVAVLIDFGIIVPQSIIDYFPLGIVNSHFSLLPEWRGADPITFAILSGQKTTGVSLMLLVAEMDKGPLLAQGTYDLPPAITTPELTEDLIDLSYQMLIEVLPRYVSGDIAPYDQDEAKGVTYSRKLSKEDSLVDWHKPADQIEREVRAFAGWPKTRATFDGLELIITKSHVIDLNGVPGKATIENKLPVVFCGEKALALDIVKPAGKKEMTGEAFLAGYKTAFLG
ncbi:MAG TPA: methionyl-tRNA formyltransferase [Candidatus Saccharimonadales bacterium]|nr:methionyl-tRNA formyltransferase [Candidatus Saccharimonadales bacterium]